MRVPGMAVVEYIRSDVSPSSPYIVVDPRGRSGRVAVQLVENARNALVCVFLSRTEKFTYTALGESALFEQYTTCASLVW